MTGLIGPLVKDMTGYENDFHFEMKKEMFDDGLEFSSQLYL